MDEDQLSIDFTDTPDLEESKKLTELGVEFVTTEQLIKQKKQELSELESRLNTLAHVELPRFMLEVHQDVIGLPSWDVDLKLQAFYQANIGSTWEEERREKAFAYLESRGDGDIIKAQLVIEAGKGSLATLKELQPLFEKTLEEAGVDATVTVNKSVHHMTLTAYVKEQVEAGEEIELETLGAVVGNIVKIKKRN